MQKSEYKWSKNQNINGAHPSCDFLCESLLKICIYQVHGQHSSFNLNMGISDKPI